MPLQPVQVDLSRLTTRQSLSRYNLDSRLDNVINNGTGLESIYGQRLIRDLSIPLGISGSKRARSVYNTSIGRDSINPSDKNAVNDGNKYVCAGNEIWKIYNDNQAPHLCGTLHNSSGPVYWAESQNQETQDVYLYITDKIGLYRLNMLERAPSEQNGGWQDITAAMPFVNGSSVEKAIPSFISFRGHRLLLTCRNSTQFFFSVLNPDRGDPSEMFGSLSFYSTEAKADRTVRVIGLDVIYAFGSHSAEIWRDNNDSNDPYSTSIRDYYSEGLLFPDAVAVHGSELYYFDDYRRLCRMSGGRKEVLSDRSMERVWDGATFSNAFTIYANGCFLACFQDDSGFTLCYNARSGSVSELSCLKRVCSALDGILLSADGRLCEFDDKTYTMSDGEVISKSVQLEVLNSHNLFSLRQVDIDYSIQTVPDENPLNNQAFLFVSPDGLNWGGARILRLRRHENTLKEYGFGLCRKMQARILFTNSNPVVFNSVTFHIQGARK